MTNVTLELWQLILLLLAFFGAVATFGKLLLTQFEKRLDERFATVKSEGSKAADVERQLLMLRADLPLNYVRREDYIAGQSVLMAKLDALYSKIENIQLRGLQ